MSRLQRWQFSSYIHEAEAKKKSHLHYSKYLSAYSKNHVSTSETFPSRHADFFLPALYWYQKTLLGIDYVNPFPLTPLHPSAPSIKQLHFLCVLSSKKASKPSLTSSADIAPPWSKSNLLSHKLRLPDWLWLFEQRSESAPFVLDNKSEASLSALIS